MVIRMLVLPTSRISLKVIVLRLIGWIIGSVIAIASSTSEDNETPADELESEDLEYVLKLNAAIGRSAMMLMNKEKSIASFQASLDVSNFATMLAKCMFRIHL